MKVIPSWSLLLTTYNWPEALEACLQSTFTQTLLPKEIIVSDDSSTDSTKQVIDHLRKVCPVSLVHFRQPDEGFQVSKAKNKGIAASAGEYIIQIEGDVILPKGSIKDHAYHAKPGTFFSGNCFYLSSELSQQMFWGHTIPYLLK